MLFKERDVTRFALLSCLMNVKQKQGTYFNSTPKISCIHGLKQERYHVVSSELKHIEKSANVHNRLLTSLQLHRSMRKTYFMEVV